MERGHIYLVSLDQTAGHEQQGARQVPDRFTKQVQPADRRPHRAPDHARRGFCPYERIRSFRARAHHGRGPGQAVSPLGLEAIVAR